MTKKRKAKLRVGRVVLCTLVLLVLITGITMLIIHLLSKYRTSKPSGGGTTKPSGTVIENTIRDNEEYIEIEQADCSLYVGSYLQLTYVAVPEELGKQINWSSTNEQVITVSQNGLVHVVGTGTGAVVAVAGTYSDSVIVVGISEGQSEEQTEYPIYIPETTSETNESEESQPQNETTTENNPTSGSIQESDTSRQPVEETTKESRTQEDTEPEVTIPTTQTPTTDPEQDDREVLRDKINELGFSQYVDGVYVYREDGNYLGEVIIDETNMQIYLKTRTSSFDNNLKNLLASVLPNAYETAYSKLINASETTTLTLDGHRIRVIVTNGSEESHKQMILYY